MAGFPNPRSDTPFVFQLVCVCLYACVLALPPARVRACTAVDRRYTAPVA